MNKNKKIAMAVVSTVMAGSMVFSFTACNNGPSTVTSRHPGHGTVADTVTVAGMQLNVDADGNLAFNADTKINANIGYSGAATGIAFATTGDLPFSGPSSSSVTLSDGVTYNRGDLKPSWYGLQEALGAEIVDVYTGEGTSDQLKTCETNGLEKYDIITCGAEDVVTRATADSSKYLDLSAFLDYMPNYKAFLASNPIIQLSLTSTDASGNLGAMYYTPYFDGNDDIEKYEIARKDYIVKILDSADVSAATTTFAAQAAAKKGMTYNKAEGKAVADPVGTATSVDSFMGTTGSWEVDALQSDGTTVTKVVVNYDAAKTAANTAGTALNTALKAAWSGFTSTDSGNIVDLQNAVIDGTSGAVTGAQLIGILQAYIDVAYQTESGAKFYSTRSDVFNGISAAWDVDLFVALSRCYVCSGNLLGANQGGTNEKWLFATAQRAASMNRMNDQPSFISELYGVRGLTSRLQNAYIDASGTLQDARNNQDTWEALDLWSNLVAEGLVYTGDSIGSDGTVTMYDNSEHAQVLMTYDYVQTQTIAGFGLEGYGTYAGKLQEGYDLAPILTPVSKWNTNEGTTADTDGKETIMRFTESWRSVKNTGVCVSKKAVANNPDKLSAVLYLIDYFYSNDGQILMSYGPQASGKTAGDGFWYGTKANVTLDAAKTQGIVDTYDGEQYFVKDAYKSQYFCYHNELYTGLLYNGRQIPVMTDKNLDSFHGVQVNGYTANAALSYTSYARQVIGACLPIGVKDQGFEYQCSSQCGLDGATIVSQALAADVIKHVYQQVDNAKNNYWYTIVPTTVPYTSSQSTDISTNMKDLTGTLYANSSSTYMNMFVEVAWYGFANRQVTSDAANYNTSSAAKCVETVTAYRGNTLETYMNEAWQKLLDHYNSTKG